MKNARSDTLQVDEDRAWQERFWTVQRIGWLAMGLLILAALFGATGKGGPLASASADLGDGTLEYPRITRWQSDEQLTLRLHPSAQGEAQLLLSPEFARLYAIQSIEPEPADVVATPAGHRFTFETEGAGGERLVAFNVRAGKPVLAQRVRASLGTGPGQVITVTVLP